MNRALAALALLPLLLVGGIWHLSSGSSGTVLTHPGSAGGHVEPAPLCPWREPERDLRRFFPGATGTRSELRILSHLRLALLPELGRPLTADEFLLRPVRVLRGSERLGTVLVRRVKGEYGAIELVLAVTPDGRVRGVRLQRQREPETIAAALTSPRWLGAFQGKSAAAPLRIGADLPAVPPQALPSARAMAEGVRSLLILLHAAETRGRRGVA
jgi:hypothetical protein